MNPIVFLAFFMAIIGATVGSTRRISEGNEALVERSGRYHRKLTPGLNFGILPFVDEIVIEADTREQILYISPNDWEAVTADNVKVSIEPIVYWKIFDLENAHYVIRNLEEGVANITVTGFRAEIGRMIFQETIVDRDRIARSLLESLDNATESWGLKVTRVEIKNIKLADATQDTISIPFAHGLNLKALEYSLFSVITDNENIQLSIQGISQRDDGVLIITVKVPTEANKERIFIDLIQKYEASIQVIEAKYQAELRGKEDQITIYRQHYSGLEDIIHKLTSKPNAIESVTVEVKAVSESKVMNKNTDQSQKFSVGGDFNIDADNSVVALREISGNVTNTINQLQNTERPKAIQLAQYLDELQKAIEAEPSLKADDKTEALEQINLLAEAEQNPQDGTLKRLANTAIKILKGTVATLPDAAKLTEAASKLLPLITSLLGL